MSQSGEAFVDIDSLDKIRIVDYQNFNYNWFYGRTYEILKRNGNFRMELVEQLGPGLTKEDKLIISRIDTVDVKAKDYIQVVKSLSAALPDSIREHSIDLAYKLIWRDQLLGSGPGERIIIETFQSDQLLLLVDAVNDPGSRLVTSIASNLGMNSEWIKESAPRLFETYKLRDVSPTDKEREYCISCFLDKRKVMLAAYSLQGGHNSSDYPFVEMQFISGRDTLSMHTDNPNSLSIPWLLNDSTKIYNPQVSIVLAEMLPDLLYSNKQRLSGARLLVNSKEFKSFEEFLSKRLINKFCTEVRGNERFYVDKEKVSQNR